VAGIPPFWSSITLILLLKDTCSHNYHLLFKKKNPKDEAIMWGLTGRAGTLKWQFTVGRRQLAVGNN
jgi:hypothetical protein